MTTRILIVLTLFGGVSAWRPQLDTLLQAGWNMLPGSEPQPGEQHRLDGNTIEAEKDFVKSLPGFARHKTLDFGLYAGYITVSEEAGRALFYTFAESQTNTAEHPLVLWLNGGPGCSSIGGGFLSELGPFYPTKDGKHLVKNANAWNHDANVLFIESPAFVGFSYSNSSGDIFVGDYRTAQDLVAFLKGFFTRFPAYAGRPFWISGESYGGHYVPNLAAALLDAQREGSLPMGADGSPVINLQGFLVGNAWTDPKTDNEGCVDFWWAHGLISDETRDGIKAKCDFSDIGPLLRGGQQGAASAEAAALLSAGAGAANDECQKLLDHVPAEMGQVNIYDIYVDVCLPERHSAPARQLAAALAGTATSAAAAAMARTPALQSDKSQAAKYDPCVDNEVTEYLNQQDVQEALHVWTPARGFPTYQICNSAIVYNRSDVFTSMLPVYSKLLDAKLKMLVFSGDVDGIVPLVGSRRWVAGLGLPVRSPWRPFYTDSGQVGGRVVVYDGLTFATVRNAGHMVPYTQPERATWLFRRNLICVTQKLDPRQGAVMRAGCSPGIAEVVCLAVQALRQPKTMMLVTPSLTLQLRQTQRAAAGS